jgi:hypothetical protein
MGIMHQHDNFEINYYETFLIQGADYSKLILTHDMCVYHHSFTV